MASWTHKPPRTSTRRPGFPGGAMLVVRAVLYAVPWPLVAAVAICAVPFIMVPLMDWWAA